MTVPRFIDDEAFRSLRAGDLDAYHRLIADRDVVDFADADLRGTDMRKADLSKVTVAGCYLRDADLRGLDLRHMNLEGCSLYHARISGAYFPDDLAPEEIRLSVEFGTRLRVRR